MKRPTIITLGCKDLDKSKRFYRSVFGWKPSRMSQGDIVFFEMGGWLLALYPWHLLAEDACAPAKGPGFSGITLAHNVRRKSDVAVFLKKARSKGAKIIKPAQDVFWGGHSGYFADPSGHRWEVAWNPFLTLKKDGTVGLS